MQDSSQRKYIRAKPDDSEYAQIDMNIEGEFSFQYAALIIEESPMGGCSIACLEKVGLSKGIVCRIKVGHMAPLKAEVVWERRLDQEVIRYGLKFLE